MAGPRKPPGPLAAQAFPPWVNLWPSMCRQQHAHWLHGEHGRTEMATNRPASVCCTAFAAAAPHRSHRSHVTWLAPGPRRPLAARVDGKPVRNVKARFSVPRHAAANGAAPPASPPRHTAQTNVVDHSRCTNKRSALRTCPASSCARRCPR